MIRLCRVRRYPLYLQIDEAELRAPMVLHSHLAVDLGFVPLTMCLFSQEYLEEVDTSVGQI